MKSTFSLIGVISIIFAMFVWASSFIALKSALGHYEPYTVIFIRMLFASFCFIFFIRQFLKYTFTKEDIKYIILLSLFEPLLYFIFEAKALQLTSASQAGMIASLMPLITSVAAFFVLKELISKQFIFGSFLAVFGAIWLSYEGSANISQNTPNPMLGNFLEFLAMCCGAGYTIVAKKLIKKFSALFITASQAFLGAIFFLPLASYELMTKAFIFNLDAFLWIIYLGVVVTLGGYGLYNFALTKISASKTAAFVNLIPIFTLILAYVLLNEKLTYVEIIASIVILIGVFLSQTKIVIPKKIYSIIKNAKS